MQQEVDLTRGEQEISLNNSVSPYPGSLSPNEIGPPLLPPKRTHHKVPLSPSLASRRAPPS